MKMKFGMLIENMFRYIFIIFARSSLINLQVQQVQKRNMQVKSEFLAHIYSKPRQFQKILSFIQQIVIYEYSFVQSRIFKMFLGKIYRKLKEETLTSKKSFVVQSFP
jgi:hypothetical protein